MKRKAVLFTALLATLFFYAIWWKSPFLGSLDNKIYDLLVVPDREPLRSHATVIVEIDEKSLQAFGQWPWPRVVMAQLLEKIAAMNPSATAFDIIYPEPDRTSPASLGMFYNDFFHLDLTLSGLPNGLRDNDRILADAMGRMNITLALFFDPSRSADKECYLPKASVIDSFTRDNNLFYSPYLLCNLPIFQHAAQGAGHIQAAPDDDGILRRLPLFIGYKEALIPTLGVAALSTLDPAVKLSVERWRGDITAEVLGHSVHMDREGEVLLRYYPLETYNRVSALDVLSGKADPSLFQGKIVFIGTTAMGLYDRYTHSDGSIRSGIFSHATLIENLADDRLIVQPSIYKSIALALSLVSAIALMVLMQSKKYLYLVILFSSVVLIAIVGTVMMLHYNLYLSTGYFIIPLTSYLFMLSIILFVIYYRNQKLFYEKMSKANEAMIDSMALVAETRDTDTGAHIIRTKEYISLLAKHIASQNIYSDILTPEYITDLYHAAPLHDVGKVGIPDEILKKNGKLTFEEFEVMKTHTSLGEEIIENAMRAYKNTTMLKVAYNIAYYHHEKWDGTGYPNRLKGEEIPLEARLMALADVYDALISRRVYKEAFSYEDAENIIIEGRGTHFDPILVDAFVVIKDRYKAIAEKINEKVLHSSV